MVGINIIEVRAEDEGIILSTYEDKDADRERSESN